MVYVPAPLNLPNDCFSLPSDDSVVNMMKQNLSEQINLGINNKRHKYKVLVRSHCGRKKNTKRELSVTLSHLYAIRSGWCFCYCYHYL